MHHSAHLRTKEAPLAPPPLPNSPRQPRLDGRGVLIQIVPVETQPGFQPQAVTCPQAGQPDALLGLQNCVGEGHRVLVRDADLKTVLSGVPAGLEGSG